MHNKWKVLTWHYHFCSSSWRFGTFHQVVFALLSRSFVVACTILVLVQGLDDIICRLLNSQFRKIGVHKIIRFLVPLLNFHDLLMIFSIYNPKLNHFTMRVRLILRNTLTSICTCMYKFIVFATVISELLQTLL